MFFNNIGRMIKKISREEGRTKEVTLCSILIIRIFKIKTFQNYIWKIKIYNKQIFMHFTRCFSIWPSIIKILFIFQCVGYTTIVTLNWRDSVLLLRWSIGWCPKTKTHVNANHVVASVIVSFGLRLCCVTRENNS